MASVRISQNLIGHVNQKFNELFEKRLKAKNEALAAIHGVADACYDATYPAELLAPLLKLEETTGFKWVQYTKNAQISIKFVRENASLANYTLYQEFSTLRPTPDSQSNHRHTLMELKPHMYGYDHLVQLYKDIEELNAEKQHLVQHVIHGILMKCSTLRQVLEVWPNALEFMPDTAIRQHNATIEKRVNPAKELVVDDQTKVTLAKARMLQGTP